MKLDILSLFLQRYILGLFLGSSKSSQGRSLNTEPLVSNQDIAIRHHQSGNHIYVQLEKWGLKKSPSPYDFDCF